MVDFILTMIFGPKGSCRQCSTKIKYRGYCKSCSDELKHELWEW